MGRKKGMTSGREAKRKEMPFIPLDTLSRHLSAINAHQNALDSEGERDKDPSLWSTVSGSTGKEGTRKGQEN